MDVSASTPFSKIICPHCGSSVRVRTIMGKYQITGVLGAGGMSQVFRAVDVHLQREVALKILHRSLSQDSALTAMFEREAKLTASILHPNVVKVYTVGEDQGYFFIAMELVDATSLEEMLVHKGALPESKVLQIAHDVTNGLKAAHEESLIHRDIKPGNMLVMADGTAKLVDFGLAVHQGGEDESEDLWATPFYVPPEKLEGEIDTYLGDIYSLGATLYHALVGNPPFEANTSSLEELKIIKKSEVDLKSEAPQVTKSTLKLIESMMAYSAGDRPQSYDDIIHQIEDIEKRQFGIRRRGRDGKRDMKLSWLIVGIFSALTAVVVSIYIKLQDDSNVSQPGDFGIGTGERVISAGDNNNTEKFLEGRELVAEGKFRKAEPIFDALAGQTTPSATTRMWTYYFQGLIRLFLGKEKESRESFGLVEAVAPETSADPAVRLMKRMSLLLSDPLPVMEGQEEFSNDSIEMVGLLAVALKNWQQGQFDSGNRMLASFSSGTAPDGFEWLGSLQAQVKSFQADYEALQKAPNPSRKSGTNLDGQKAALQALLDGAKTSGAYPRLLKVRIDRIDQIQELVAAEKAEKERQKAIVAAANVEPKPQGNLPPNGKKMTAEGEAERERMLELLSTLRGYSETLLFSGAVSKLEAETFSTPVGNQLKQDLIYGFGKADSFVSLLAAKLDGAEYEGLIRRREGVPLDAKITAADSSVFVVDLGFGPNEVEVGVFAPDWLVEAAETEFDPPAEGNIEMWESAVFFALATGDAAGADRIAEKLEGKAPDFEQRWKRLLRLRKKED